MKEDWEHLYRQKWYGINRRCNHDPYYKNRIQNDFANYQEFKSFCETEYFASGVTLDRIHPTGNYSSENCQFLTLSDHRLKTAKEHRRFSEDQILEIRNRAKQESTYKLAAEFDCSQTLICQIVNRHIYKDI
tara:strand:+ start:528 stop:923 length:396 start_codon:yes stop_codon:yes gene_type:complete